MKPVLVDLLRAPGDQAALSLDRTDTAGEIVSGSLRTADGRVYEVRDGIPRFATAVDSAQAQTRDAFAFKWAKRDTYDSAGSRRRMAAWLLERYGFPSVEAWAGHFNQYGRVLDVGCGSGLSSGTWLTSPGWNGSAMWVGLDVSSAVDVARDRLGAVPNTHFVQADALHLPFADATFGAVFSEGVLHHTASTRDALMASARVLASGGEFSFYVYRKKGPAREFTDDYVREQLRTLGDEDAWERMRELTRLAQALASVDAEVEVTEPVPLLGIAAGTHRVQRFVYWNFAKLYWNDEMTFEENVHVNFDWYRPAYAHRQTETDVRGWCEDAALDIVRFDAQESGFTVVARKR